MNSRVRRALAVVAVLAGVGIAVAAGPARRALVSAYWDLDIERAMTVIGVAPGMVVGEAGAGDGYFTLPMAARVGPAGVVIANDISARSLSTLASRAAGQGLSNITTVVGDVADPKFPRRDLHMIVIVHALHDFSEPVAWLKAAKSYLRPGGTVAVIDRDPEQGAERHFWPRARIEQYASDAGYTLTRAEAGISKHLILVFSPAP